MTKQNVDPLFSGEFKVGDVVDVLHTVNGTTSTLGMIKKIDGAYINVLLRDDERTEYIAEFYPNELKFLGRGEEWRVLFAL